MKFPQAYLVINNQYKFPALSTLQDWSESSTPIYVKQISSSNSSIDQQIDGIRRIQKYTQDDYDVTDKMIVINCTEIGYFLLVSLGANLKKIYWIDDEKQLEKIYGLTDAIEMAIDFDNSISNAFDDYEFLLDFVANQRSDGFLRDEQLDRFFSSRFGWGDASVVEHALKRIAKDETRAGVLKRIDLQS